MKKPIRIIVLIGILSLPVMQVFSQKSHKSLKFEAYNTEMTTVERSKGMTFDKKTGILYKVSNNEQSIAFDMVINEDITQKKILFFGAKVWIDTLGKSKKKLGVMFPIGRKELAGMNQSNKKPEQGTGDNNERMKKMAGLMKTIEIIGLNENNKNDSINSLEAEDITAKTEIDALGIMYYRLEVPFNRLGLSFDQIKDKDISIDFETGYLDITQMQGGGMRPGGGRPPGGGIQPGSNDERKAMMEAMMESDSFKIKGLKLYSQK